VANLDGLPGAEIVAAGLRDLRLGTETMPALLVTIGAARLRRAGLDVPNGPASPEHRLYALLLEEFGNGAHARYNGWLRRLVSFERALECAG
jgi:hypothetical protein